MDFKQMNELTLKVLETPDKLNSNEFLAIYNTVYLECTQKLDVFVVRGKSVYQQLKKVICDYFESLKPLTSLNSFNLFSKRLQTSINLLKDVYSYLERYYIKSTIKLRDGYTVDITTLVYNTGYSNYLSQYMTNIREYIIYEIEFQRKASKPKFKEINQANGYLKTFLLYNDLQIEYDELMNRYYSGFYGFIKDKDVLTLIICTTKEIFNFTNIFNNNQRGEIQKLIYCVSKRFKEVLELFQIDYVDPQQSDLIKIAGLNHTDVNDNSAYGGLLYRSRKNNLLEYFSRLVYYMRDEQVREFSNVFELLVKREMENLLSIKESILYLINFMILTSCIPINLSKTVGFVKESVKKSFMVEDHIEVCISLVEELRNDECEEIKYLSNCSQYKNVTKHKLMDLLMKTIKLSSAFEQIIYKIIANIQLRLITNDESYNIGESNEPDGIVSTLPKSSSIDFYGTIGTDGNEPTSIGLDLMILSTIERNFGVSYVSWLKVGVERFLQPLSQTFAISNQEEKFKTDIRLITKGFWKWSPVSLVLHPTLSGIENLLTRQCLLTLPKSKIQSIYQVSPAIFSLNNFDFRVSTDILSLVLYFNEYSSYEKVKEVSQDPNFIDNVNLLLSNNILVVNNGEYYLNGAFNQCDYERLLSQRVKGNKDPHTGFIDLFNVHFEDLQLEKGGNAKSNRLEIVIEAFVVRTLKKNKKIKVNELVKMVKKRSGFNDKEVFDIIKRLETKEYLKIEGEDIVYLV